MDISRAFPVVFAFCAAAMAPAAAHADVFELASNGNFAQVSQSARQPEAVAIPDEFAHMVSQNLTAPVQPLSNVRQHIQVAAERYGISSDLVDAVAWQESRYNPRAKSSAGALGVMQLMPGTARQLGVSNPHDVGQNVAGGAAYLRAQLERFGNNVPLALAAYNAGPGAVLKYGGIPPYRETQNYVRQIMRRLSAMSLQRSSY